MKRIAITNEKGGSVKTTTTTSLAAALGERGRKVLVVDLDGQANATTWLGARPSAAGGLLEALAEGQGLVELVQRTSWTGVDVIPATSRLKAAETALRTEPGAEHLLRAALDALPTGRWDYLLMDCPPTLWMSIVAMTAADELLAPVEASYLALEGLAALAATAETVRQRLNARLRLAGVLMCRVDPRVIARPRSASDLERIVRTRFDGQAFDATIRECVRVKEAPSHRQPITAYAPESTAAQDYRRAAIELEARG